MKGEYVEAVLTDDQAKLFLALRIGKGAGQIPTVRELAELLECGTATIQKRMRELEALGVIRRERGKHRTVVILKGKVA